MNTEHNIELRSILVFAAIILGVNMFFLVIAFGGNIFEKYERTDHYNTSGLVLDFDFSQSSIEDRVLEDHVRDLSENHQGNVFGAEWISNETARNDGAFKFDGMDDYIQVRDSDDFSINTTGEITVAFWIRFDNTDFVGEGSHKDYIHFLGKGGNGQDYEWMWRLYNRSNSENRNNRISFYIFNIEGGLGSGSYIEDKIKPGQWMHLVGVVRDNNIELWKNGVLRDRDKLSDYAIFPQNANAPLNIGTADGDSYLNGSIDDIKIYNRALNKKEIKELYSSR